MRAINYPIKNRKYCALIDSTDLDKIKDGYLTDKSSKGRIDVMFCKDGKRVLLSRFLVNSPLDHFVIFKSGNRLDFRRENLKIIHKSENYYHHSTRKSSIYHGVHYNSTANRWVVSLILQGELIRDHYYKNESDAGLAAEYQMRIHDFSSSTFNFLTLSNQEVIAQYNALRDKFGKSRKEIKTKAQQGIKPKKATVSQHVGVSFDKRGRKKPRSAKIKYQGKKIYLGSYYTEIEAAKAYNIKALEIYGPTAKLNSIPTTLN